MRKFRSRKHFSFSWLLFIFVFFIVGFVLCFFLSFKFFCLDVSSLIGSSSVFYRVNVGGFFGRFLCKLAGVDINSPDTILQSVMFYHSSNDVQYFYVQNDVVTSDVQVVDNSSNSVPLVYIYNTHDTEEYYDDYGVFEASFYLRDRLSDLGISSIVEENRTSSIRDSNGWNYGLSYRASRINLERVYNENPSIKLFIDLHRDSVSRKYTSVSIDGKDYAKVLFVVGKEHDHYLDNLSFTRSIDSIINSKYFGLSKGILEKAGPGVNGIYNQDIGSNVILLEVGGNENVSLEVKNTLDAIASVIKENLYG